MTRHRVIMYSPNYKYTHAFHPAVYLALFALVSRHGLPGQLLRHHLGHLPSLLGAGDWTLHLSPQHGNHRCSCLGPGEGEDGDEDEDEDGYEYDVYDVYDEEDDDEDDDEYEDEDERCDT